MKTFSIFVVLLKLSFIEDINIIISKTDKERNICQNF